MCTHTKRTPHVTVGTPSGHVPHYDDAISIASAEESITKSESNDHDVDPIINASDETAKKILLDRLRKCSHQLQRSSTPSPPLPDLDIKAFSYHDDDLPTMDEEPAPIESANSRGDSDSDGHVLSTVWRSNHIASKVAQVCQNCWGSGHQELIQEDDPSSELDTDGESLGDKETDDEDTNWWRIRSAAPGEEGISLWDLLGQDFLK